MPLGVRSRTFATPVVAMSGAFDGADGWCGGIQNDSPWASRVRARRPQQVLRLRLSRDLPKLRGSAFHLGRRPCARAARKREASCNTSAPGAASPPLASPRP